MAGVLSVTILSCSDRQQANPIVSERCPKAFSEAASERRTTGEAPNLYPLLEACQSIDEWLAASKENPSALGTEDPMRLLRLLCRSLPSPEPTPKICSEVVETASPSS